MQRCPHLKDEKGLTITIGGEEYQLCEECVSKAIRWRRVFSPEEMIRNLTQKWSVLLD